MATKLINAWGQGCLRRLLLQAAVAAVVIPLAGMCVFLPLSFVSNSNSTDTISLIWLAISVVMFIGLLVGGSVGLSAWFLIRRARSLDAAFTPLGLTGGMYLLNGRQYHGTVNGRQADIYFYRGPALDIYLKAPFRTRVSLSVKDRVGTAIAGAFNRQPLPIADSELSRLNIFALDANWTQALLADPAARDSLLRLLAEESAIEIRQIHIQPDAILFRLYHTHPDRATESNARQWFNDLTMLARCAEALPAPQQTAEASAWEGGGPAQRNRIMLIAAGLTLVFVIGLPLCTFIPALALILLTQK